MTADVMHLDNNAYVERLLALQAQAHRARVHQRLIQETVLAVERARQQVAALNEQKDEFLGMTAHDLRTPLTVIQGFAMTMGLYPEIQESEELAEFTQLIETSAGRMLFLINDLLDIAKIESGKLELNCTPTDLREVIEHNTRMHRSLAEAKGIQLETELPEEPVAADVDAERMSQVLTNLLSNAVKFSESGTTITAGLARDGGEARMTVRDQGRGIPPEDLAHVFERFRQTKTKSTAGEKGTGLGLAIVKKIVELHGGRVTVESELERGSTFTIHLSAARRRSTAHSG